MLAQLKRNAYLCNKKFKFNITPWQDNRLKMVTSYEEISRNRREFQRHIR